MLSAGIPPSILGRSSFPVHFFGYADSCNSLSVETLWIVTSTWPSSDKIYKSVLCNTVKKFRLKSASLQGVAHSDSWSSSRRRMLDPLSTLWNAVFSTEAELLSNDSPQALKLDEGALFSMDEPPADHVVVIDSYNEKFHWMFCIWKIFSSSALCGLNVSKSSWKTCKNRPVVRKTIPHLSR